MDRSQESLIIIAKIKVSDFSYSDHGSTRALERTLPVNEVIHIAKTYIRWEWQEQKQTHLFVGYRINGKGAGFSAVLRNNAIIITVFKRTIKKWEKKYE